MEAVTQDIQTQRRVAYIVSEQLAKVSSLLPSNRGRSLLVHQLVVACDLLRPHPNAAQALLVRPSPANKEALLAFHDEDYVDYVLNPSPPEDASRAHEGVDGREFGIEEDCPWFKGLHIYVPLVAGATLTAARMLIEGRAEVAIAWDGGRHHAQKSHASGFCYVADIPLALLQLKKAPGRPKVMYIDLDLHFSDGVSIPFSNRQTSSPSRLLTLSIHHAAPGFFPSHRLASLPSLEEGMDPYTLSLPLHKGASNKTFARIWNSVELLKEAFLPDYVLVQCGVDGLSGDPMGIWNWGLDRNDDGSLGWCVERILEWGCKTLLVGGGGYQSANAARAWTYLTSIALQRPLDTDMAIPEHDQWPKYAPSFTMEIEKGNMADENGEEYLEGIGQRFRALTDRIQQLNHA